MSYETEHTAVRIDELQKLHEQIDTLREALADDRAKAAEALYNKSIQVDYWKDAQAYAENQYLQCCKENAILREALERIAGTRIDGKACDIIADCKDYTEALEEMAKEALQRAGGGE